MREYKEKLYLPLKEEDHGNVGIPLTPILYDISYIYFYYNLNIREKD